MDRPPPVSVGYWTTKDTKRDAKFVVQRLRYRTATPFVKMA